MGHGQTSFSWLGWQYEERIDRDARGVDLEVEMGPGGDPGQADLPDDLAGDHRLADVNRELGLQVAVQGEDVGLVLDFDHDRAVGQAPGYDHLARGDGPHRRAERRRDVDAGVEVGVAVALVAARRLEGEEVGPKPWVIGPSSGQTRSAPYP